MAIAKKAAPPVIPRFAPGRMPSSSPRFMPAAPLPIPKEIKMPPHDYLRPREAGFPISKILPKEVETTYGGLNPAAKYMRFFGFVAIISIYAAFSLMAVFAASAVFPIWAGLLCAIAIALPFALSELIEIAFLLETFRFSLQREYLFVRTGAIDPTYELIPYENIQDAQVSQGLVDKLFNVSSVVVSTPASSIFIGFLPNETAKKFREDLLTLAQLHKNMAE